MMFTIRGIPTAGIAVGTAFVLQRRASAAATAAAGDPVAEAGRFHAALERAKAELSALAEGEAVFAAHLEMAGDPMLAGLVEGRIAEKHLSAEQALGEACEEVCGMFAALDDDYLRGRTDDVRDVCARIRRVLSGKTAHDPFAGLAPGTIVVADELAARARFFSIGTNDLTQYVMAADRGNPRVAYLCDAFDPAVQRSIGMVLDAAHRAGIEAGMCGELAADPRATQRLVALGLGEFSVGPPAIAPLKHRIRTDK